MSSFVHPTRAARALRIVVTGIVPVTAVLVAVVGWVLSASIASADDSPPPKPVLMVIANQDFYYQEYGDTRASLESEGLDVVVAATTTEIARPHPARHGGLVEPDVALADVEADDYSAIVFVGGWGSASYQYDFPGTYSQPAYRGGHGAHAANALVEDMLRDDKYVTAIGHGVSVLAWARADGASPLEGRRVAGSPLLSPAFDLEGRRFEGVDVRWHVQRNGGQLQVPGSQGDPMTAEDDVYVDGMIITAESYDAAAAFAKGLADALEF